MRYYKIVHNFSAYLVQHTHTMIIFVLLKIYTMQNLTILGKEYSYFELQSKFGIPNDCTMNGCNLVPLEASAQIEYLRFKHFIAMFPLDGFAGKTADKLSEIDELFENPINLFNPDVVNVVALRKVGFGPSQAPSFIEELEKYKTSGIPLFRFIKALSIDGCGNTISKEYSKKMSGVEYDFKGLTKEIITELNLRELEICQMVQFVEHYGYVVIQDKPIIQVEKSADSKNYILTGSPKDFGFKTKAEFQQQIPNWIEVKKMSDADYLITDDLESKSSKTKDATKLGKDIITYNQAVELYKS